MRIWRFAAPRKVQILTVLVAIVVVGAGFLIWYLRGPFGPARQLVGTWYVQNAPAATQPIQGQLESALPEPAKFVAKDLAEKFHSNERLYVDRNGKFRFVESIFGVTMTTEGNWQVRSAERGKLVVAFHRKTVFLRNPQNGEVKGGPDEGTLDWVITVVDADHLLASITDAKDGTIQRFKLYRAKS